TGGEEEDAPVRREVDTALHQELGAEGPERACTEGTQQQSERAAGGGDHEALGEQLADEASAFGAERGADAGLADAARDARELQMREIGARDQQDQSDDRG